MSLAVSVEWSPLWCPCRKEIFIESIGLGNGLVLVVVGSLVAEISWKAWKWTERKAEMGWKWPEKRLVEQGVNHGPTGYADVTKSFLNKPCGLGYPYKLFTHYYWAKMARIPFT